MDALTQAALADIVWTWEQVSKRVKEAGTLVYVIDAPQVEATKIGFTRGLQRRFYQLQGGCPVELFLRFAYPAHEQHEWEVHQVLYDAKVRGEWFKTPAVDQFYAQIEGIRGERDREVSMLEAFHVWRMRYTVPYPGETYREPLW
jgi:hypothetical protein